MKKKSPIILTLICIIFFSACSKKDSPLQPVIIAPTKPTDPGNGNAATITAFIGDTITISNKSSGTNPGSLLVKFGTIQANVVSVSEAAVKAIVPDDIEGAAVKIHFYSGNNEVLPANDFNLKSPVIKSISPTSGPAGQQIVITGQGFTLNKSNQVTFGGKVVSATNAGHTSLSIQIPGGTSPGQYPIAVTVAGLTTTSTTPFTVVASKAPTFTGFTPQTAFIGDTIVLTGTDLGTNPNALQVKFGNIAATVISVSGTSAKVIVPGDIELASVKISIAAGGSQIFSNTNFQLKAPIISSISITSGFIGDELHIYGKGFSYSYKVKQINFGNTALPALFAGNSDLMIFVPRGSTAGKYPISVTVAGLTTTGTYTFEVLVPTITSFTPNSGKKDDIMVINGTNFKEVNGITDIRSPRVFFDEIAPGSNSQEVSYYLKQENNQIQIRIPQLKVGSSYKIRVAVKVGISVTSTDTFTYKE